MAFCISWKVKLFFGVYVQEGCKNSGHPVDRVLEYKGLRWASVCCASAGVQGEAAKQSFHSL